MSEQRTEAQPYTHKPLAEWSNEGLLGMLTSCVIIMATSNTRMEDTGYWTYHAEILRRLPSYAAQDARP